MPLWSIDNKKFKSLLGITKVQIPARGFEWDNF